jgi:hypothetical protein
MEVLPAPVHFGAGSAPIGDNNIKRVLGTVPVNADGSAYFELPARRAYTFVARNAEGNAVKFMNSFTTVLPGENLGCVGCHEPRTEAPPPVAGVMPSALGRAPDKIKPFEGVPDVIGFNRHIQPILDKHCVKCHNPKKDKGPNLNGEKYVLWSNSYRALSRPWNIGVRGSNTDPYSAGSGSSKLVKMLREGHKKVKLSPAEFETIRLWVDAGGIYAGTYGALGDQLVEHKIDRSVMEKKCYSCHVKEEPKRRGRQWPFRRFFHTDFNMTKPERSRFLMKALAKSAGGQATQTDPEKSSKRDHYIVFESKDDPEYQALVEDVRQYVESLREQRWYGTENWRPNEHYFREMKRYGVLPPDFDIQNDEADPFEVDRQYYELFYPDGD